MNLTEKFSKQAGAVFDDLKSAMPIQEIEEKFRSAKMLGADLSGKQFQTIYYAYLTAQISQRWVYCCRDLGIDSKEIQNLFFKTALDRYADAKDLDSATYFSEALYASNSEPDQYTLISILTALLKKVSVGKSLSVTAEGTAELFRFVAGVWDGYCNHFENDFDDFLAQLRLDGALSQEKRG